MTRLDFGAGPVRMPGWISVDRDPQWQATVRIDPLEQPLPFPDGSIDGIVANHSVQMIGWHDLGVLLGEFRRVLRAGAVLRILVPDTLAAHRAHARGDHRWFPIADTVCPSIDAKLSAYLTWWSEARCCHTPGSLGQHLRAAGFETILPAPFGESVLGPVWITELDSRQHESLIVEAA